jgi:hypothetical protein
MRAWHPSTRTPRRGSIANPGSAVMLAGLAIWLIASRDQEGRLSEWVFAGDHPGLALWYLFGLVVVAMSRWSLTGVNRTWRGQPISVAIDPFETSSRLAFLGSFVNIVRMTVAVITFANLWWRST